MENYVLLRNATDNSKCIELRHVELALLLIRQAVCHSLAYSLKIHVRQYFWPRKFLYNRHVTASLFLRSPKFFSFEWTSLCPLLNAFFDINEEVEARLVGAGAASGLLFWRSRKPVLLQLNVIFSLWFQLFKWIFIITFLWERKRRMERKLVFLLHDFVLDVFNTRTKKFIYDLHFTLKKT